MVDMSDLFFNYIKGRRKLPIGAIFQLKLHIAVEKIPKNGCLLKYGAVSDKMYFIVEGAMRGETRKLRNGEWKLKSSRFMLEREIVFNVESFRDGTPSKEAIYALEPVVALTITRNEYRAIEEAFPVLGCLRADLGEDVIVVDNRRFDGIQSVDAVERLEYLIEFEPEWMIRVPYKYLASFILTSAENFSRILRKLRRGK